MIVGAANDRDPPAAIASQRVLERGCVRRALRANHVSPGTVGDSDAVEIPHGVGSSRVGPDQVAVNLGARRAAPAQQNPGIGVSRDDVVNAPAGAGADDTVRTGDGKADSVSGLVASFIHTDKASLHDSAALVKNHPRTAEPGNDQRVQFGILGIENQAIAGHTSPIDPNNRRSAVGCQLGQTGDGDRVTARGQGSGKSDDRVALIGRNEERDRSPGGGIVDLRDGIAQGVTVIGVVGVVSRGRDHERLQAQ